MISKMKRSKVTDYAALRAQIVLCASLNPNYKYYRNIVRETNLANLSLDSWKIDFPIQIATIRI